MRKYFNFLLRCSLFSVFVVPLKEQGDWQLLKFSSLPSHQIDFSEKGMRVEVKKSASPIIYPLNPKMTINKVAVEGQLLGSLNLPSTIAQGAKGADDFVLRLGLVVEGEQRLSPLKRLVAAEWIKTLFDLAPKGTGVDRIQFYNIVSQSKILGTKRTHPLSEIIREENVWHLEGEKEFAFAHEFDEISVVAIWLSIDGDDTKSSYSLLLSGLKLTTP